MIPILYSPEQEPEALLDVNSIPLFDVDDVQLLAAAPAEEKRTFDTYGLGALTDCIRCEVTEERNGEFELVMEYPANGAHFSDIAERCLILATPNATDEPQAFRIYQITTPINGVITVNAEHLVYDLSGVPVLPFTAQSCAAAVLGLTRNAAVETPFEIKTQISTVADFSVTEPSSVRSWFGGKEGSLIDVYGGEWHYSNYTATLLPARGEDRGVVIRYGKNLLDVDQEKNIANMWTGVLPFWKDSQTGAIVRASIINVAGSFDFRRILCLDLSGDFQEQPTAAELTARARTYMTANKIGEPKINITLDWAQSSETVELCDTVTVEFEKLGISAKAKCIRTVWDVLKDRYSSIEFGDAKASIADTIHSLQLEEEKAQSTVTTAMMQAIANATQLITGNEGGYVVLHDTNSDGAPDEILVMDTDDISTATQVWRWNKSGFGYSGSGYSGTYGTAITMDGRIVADYITTGTMQADRIKGGTLALGGSGNGNGVAQIYDADGGIALTLNREGLVIDRTVTFYASDYSDSDTTTIKQIILGNIVPTMAQFNRYDVNGDGMISAEDLLAVQRMVLGYDTTRTLTKRINIGSSDTASVLTTDGVTIRNGGIYATNGAFNTLTDYGLYNKTSSLAANVAIDNSGVFWRSTSSSERYKEGITEDLGDLDPRALYDVKVARYRFKEGYLDESDQRYGQDVIGFIAEDMAEKYPVAVRFEGDAPETWEASYMIPAMMRLIQDQKKEIDELRERLDRLEARWMDDGR